MKTLFLILIFILVAAYAYVTVSERQKQRLIRERRPMMREIINKQEFRKALYQLRHTKRKESVKPERIPQEDIQEDIQEDVQEETLPYEDYNYYDDYDAEKLKKEPASSARPVRSLQDAGEKHLPSSQDPAPDDYPEPSENYPREDAYPENQTYEPNEGYQPPAQNYGGRISSRYEDSENYQDMVPQQQDMVPQQPEENPQQNNPSPQDLTEGKEDLEMF